MCPLHIVYQGEYLQFAFFKLSVVTTKQWTEPNNVPTVPLRNYYHFRWSLRLESGDLWWTSIKKPAKCSLWNKLDSLRFTSAKILASRRMRLLVLTVVHQQSNNIVEKARIRLLCFRNHKNFLHKVWTAARVYKRWSYRKFCTQLKYNRNHISKLKQNLSYLSLALSFSCTQKKLQTCSSRPSCTFWGSISRWADSWLDFSFCR